MVLTRSMATTNNVQGDEPPRSTTLERRVQTLMTTVKCLTKQNHDLQEQLRQRDTRQNVQKENQEDSPEQGEQERPERQNLSLPFFIDIAPPLIVAEMQAMKEQMEVMMNALKGWVSNDLDDLVNRTDSPFTNSVNSFLLPQKFCMPQIESYDGVKDLLDHLETLNSLMHFQGVPDEIMCRAFPTMLKGLARIWFSRLTSNSSTLSRS